MSVKHGGLWLLLLAAFAAGANDRPQTWLHLIGGNVSKEGIVRDLDAIAAAVKVNGKDAGVLWCEPYVADIEGLCTDGENELEIAVTSTWHNRLWYDGQLPEANRKTWTLPYLKNLSAGRLLPYGLLTEETK